MRSPQPAAVSVLVHGESRNSEETVLSDRAVTEQLLSHNVGSSYAATGGEAVVQSSGRDFAVGEMMREGKASTTAYACQVFGGERVCGHVCDHVQTAVGGTMREDEGSSCLSGSQVQPQHRDEHLNDIDLNGDEGRRHVWGQGVLVRAYPEGGRTHQIRLHCQHMGMPLVGDVRYGGPEVWNGKRWPGHALHAQEVEFQHPVNGNTVRICAPCPSWS